MAILVELRKYQKDRTSAMGKQSTHGLVYELMREGMRSTPREFPFKLNVELQDLRYSTLIPVSHSSHLTTG
jgi:hypothetical protein